MLEKTPNQIGLLFEPFERRDDMGGEFVARFAAEILQFMFFDIRPDLLIGIEFRAIRRQLFQLDDAMIFRLQKVLTASPRWIDAPSQISVSVVG